MKKSARSRAAESKRGYLKQSDVPSASLSDALRVPHAIFDHYAGRPTSPLQVAKALNVDPKGSQLRALTGAAIAFGLVEGGAQATTISVTDLARRIVRPKQEGQDYIAKQEAVLKPRVFGDFLRAYDGSMFPRADLAVNVIEEMGVPREKAEEVVERIEACAKSVGFLEEIKGKRYVQLRGTAVSETNDPTDVREDGEVEFGSETSDEPSAPSNPIDDVTICDSIDRRGPTPPRGFHHSRQEPRPSRSD